MAPHSVPDLLPFSRSAASKESPRLGYLSGSDPQRAARGAEAFRQALQDLGYVEGRNILIEYRYAHGKRDRFPSLATELVQLNVDVLFVGVLTAVQAAKQATKTIPIVMVLPVDPVATGIVDSLARPGGNITGLSRLTRELSGKRLELLSEVAPRISRVGVLWDGDDPGSRNIALKEYEAAARSMKIELQSLELRAATRDVESAFQAASKGRVSGLITIRSLLVNRYSKRIASLAIVNRLPSMYEGID
jgi:putative ABC transport system substrate-binding protein